MLGEQVRRDVEMADRLDVFGEARHHDAGRGLARRVAPDLVVGRGLFHASGAEHTLRLGRGLRGHGLALRFGFGDGLQAFDLAARLLGFGAGALAHLIQCIVAALLDQQFLLALQFQFGREFVFLDRAFLFDRLRATLEDRFVDLGLDSLARRCLQRFFDIGHRRELIDHDIDQGETHCADFAVGAERLRDAALLTSLAVSVSGIIGFVGLIVPHVVRILWGTDYRRMVPLSILGGASMLLAADALARTVLAPQVLPVGIITALAGAPFFLWLLRSVRNQAFG